MDLNSFSPLAEQFLESTSDGVFILDERYKLLFCNNRYLEITGQKMDFAKNNIPSSLKNGWHEEGFYLRLLDTLENMGRWEGETWDKRVSDDSLFVMDQKLKKYDKDGETKYLGLITDITKLLKAQQKLETLEKVDLATNITNRFYGEESLKNYLEEMEDKVAVVLCDINNFSMIPETFGHIMGDLILKGVAYRIKDTLDTEHIFSFGSDRFIVYFSYDEIGEIEDKAFRIIDALYDSFNIEDHEIFLTINLGISLLGEDGNDPEELIRNADSAMHESRKEDFNTFCFYESKMNETVLEQFHIIGDLRKAIEREELSLVYQPQVDSNSEKVLGAESLLRWNNEDRGPVSPERFIPLAEKMGLISPIGDWVLREACESFKNWKESGVIANLAINISGIQFQDKRLVPLIKNIFYNRVDTSRIELEITESSFVNDVEQGIDTMKKLKNLGFRLAIDDFGTGFSSLQYLKKFPIDKLKIDKSFITNILNDKGDVGIVKSIISLAQNLELDLIAEGVETVGQKDFLRGLGCSKVQGYYYSKPLLKDEFLRFYKERI